MLVDTLDGHDDCTVLNADAPSMTIEDAKQAKRAEVDAYLGAQFYAGFSATSGPLVGHVLQARDTTDRTNWLTSQASYRTAIDQGAGAVEGAEFRTAANETVTCTYQEGFDALMEMASWGKTLMGKSWTLKDQIAALTSVADVEAYDVNAQWAALP
jgi:hypothetical protein